MTAPTAPRPPARRRTPIDGHPYPERLLNLVALADDVIHATVPSDSERARGTIHDVFVPLDENKPIRCGPTCKARGRHWHHIAGEALRRRFLQCHESQERSSDDYLAMQVDILDPETFRKVTITYLSAKRHLDARGRRVAA